jgi:hypothetical protein
MTARLTDATIERVAKLFPRLASNFDGEVVAVARAIQRTLQADGADFHDLMVRLLPAPRLAPEQVADEWSAETWRLWCGAHVSDTRLNERDRSFLRSMADCLKKHEPSTAQLKWLRDIVEKLGG